MIRISVIFLVAASILPIEGDAEGYLETRDESALSAIYAIESAAFATNAAVFQLYQQSLLGFENRAKTVGVGALSELIIDASSLPEIRSRAGRYQDGPSGYLSPEDNQPIYLNFYVYASRISDLNAKLLRVAPAWAEEPSGELAEELVRILEEVVYLCVELEDLSRVSYAEFSTDLVRLAGQDLRRSEDAKELVSRQLEANRALISSASVLYTVSDLYERISRAVYTYVERGQLGRQEVSVIEALTQQLRDQAREL